MSSWDYSRLERSFEEFTGPLDPDDPKEKKRMRIVRAATELFIQQGYRKTSVDEVARAAHVAKGTVYLYFQTKAELMLHAIIEEKRRFLGVLKPILDDSVPARKRMRLWLETAFVLPTKMPLISRLLHGDREMLMVLEDMPADVMAKGDMLRTDFVADLIRGTVGAHERTAGEIDEISRVLYGLFFLSAVITEDRVRAGLRLERFAELLAQLIVDGLVAWSSTGASREHGKAASDRGGEP